MKMRLRGAVISILAIGSILLAGCQAGLNGIDSSSSSSSSSSASSTSSSSTSATTSSGTLGGSFPLSGPTLFSMHQFVITTNDEGVIYRPLITGFPDSTALTFTLQADVPGLFSVDPATGAISIVESSAANLKDLVEQDIELRLGVSSSVQPSVMAEFPLRARVVAPADYAVAPLVATLVFPPVSSNWAADDDGMLNVIVRLEEVFDRATRSVSIAGKVAEKLYLNRGLWQARVSLDQGGGGVSVAVETFAGEHLTEELPLIFDAAALHSEASAGYVDIDFGRRLWLANPNGLFSWYPVDPQGRLLAVESFACSPSETGSGHSGGRSCLTAVLADNHDPRGLAMLMHDPDATGGDSSDPFSFDPQYSVNFWAGASVGSSSGSHSPAPVRVPALPAGADPYNVDLYGDFFEPLALIPKDGADLAEAAEFVSPNYTRQAPYDVPVLSRFAQQVLQQLPSRTVDIDCDQIFWARDNLIGIASDETFEIIREFPLNPALAGSVQSLAIDPTSFTAYLLVKRGTAQNSQLFAMSMFSGDLVKVNPAIEDLDSAFSVGEDTRSGINEYDYARFEDLACTVSRHGWSYLSRSARSSSSSSTTSSSGF